MSGNILDSLEELLKKISVCKNIEEAKKILFSEFKGPRDNISRAIELAVKQHEGQTRKSGEPYVIHPILVSAIVARYGGDETMVVTALLHDVVEDTETTTEEVAQMFGSDAANLVDGLTKIMTIREDKLAPSNSGEKLMSSAMNFRKMLVASISDVRVLVIKLCDRLHNMMTLNALPPNKQKRVAEETLVVYAPIAHRLGISSIKNYLEDYSFYYIMPEEYKKIDEYLVEHKQQFQLRLNLFLDKIHTLLEQNGFSDSDYELEKRIKHHYSIYIKMQRKGISIEEVLDLLAIRIITKEALDCYKALGILHKYFNPIISRFKDYIAIPKDNGYQTIHTTIFDDKSIIEAQIRTFDMHNVAEFGVAAHWKYKYSGGINPKLDWLAEIKNKEGESDNATEFYEFTKDSYLYSEDIAVFSPKGDIFTLSRGATVLDFAYEIHTEIGSHAKEAFVNRQKAPLLTELKNGDIVRIITSEEPIYRCSWVNSVKTGKARTAIMQACRQKVRELNYRVAMDILLGIFNTKESRLLTWLKKERLDKKIDKAATDSVYLQDVVNALKKYPIGEKVILPFLNRNKYQVKKQKFENIVVYSNQSVNSVTFDYCCHPKRGDDIIGFVKKADVIVHHKMCERAAKLIEAKEPMIFVKWTRDAPGQYKMLVSIENKRGSLAAFLAFLVKMQVNLQTIELNKAEDGAVEYFKIVIELPENIRPEQVRDNIKERYKLLDFVSLNDAYKTR
ncbi:MAG: RelA/SpoT family protein [Campylobacteraceae bacterium]|jgi:GTP pyrophosphokinase|nr:RelA/SpoT family protein [Campylobacteraceae bacterium]